MQFPEKMFAVHLKSDAIAQAWVDRGAKPVPLDERIVLVEERPADGTADVLRVGKVKVGEKRKAIEFATKTVLVVFEERQSAQVVRKVAGSNVVSVEPIESGAADDWSWMVHLEPQIDPIIKAAEIDRHADVSSAGADFIRMVKKNRRPPFL